MITEYSIQVDYMKRSFSIAGDQAFVEKYYVELSDALCSLPATSKEIVDNLAEGAKSSSALPADEVNKKCIGYGLYYIDEATQLPVINCSVPGNNASEKARNVARILYIASSCNPVSSDLIRAQCAKQGCYDASNFAKAFKGSSEFIVKHKSKQQWTLELTIPGKDAALDLLNDICESR